MFLALYSEKKKKLSVCVLSSKSEQVVLYVSVRISFFLPEASHRTKFDVLYVDICRCR